MARVTGTAYKVISCPTTCSAWIVGRVCGTVHCVAFVAGVDSSTQSVKVVVRDATTGAWVREGRAAHPDGTEVDPTAWWRSAGRGVLGWVCSRGFARSRVAGQQHGMVALDEDGAGGSTGVALERHPLGTRRKGSSCRTRRPRSLG